MARGVWRLVLVTCAVLHPAAVGAQDIATAHAAQAQRALQPARPAVATASAEEPKGTIVVNVVSPAGEPVANATVRLGIMQQEDGMRESQLATTGPEGTVTFADLPTGSVQAYRVNLRHAGARFSTTPFRLPPDQGMRATLVQREITDDIEAVFTLMHWVLLELRNDRLHVAEQLQLVNLSDAQYVFPSETTLERPQEALAFVAQKSMGDQRVTYTAEEGVRLAGSLPPGRTDITWGFDIPISSRDELQLVLPAAFRTMQVRVDSDAPKGLGLSVEGLPEAKVGYHRGRRILETSVQRRPGDAHASAPVRITVRDIPSSPGAGLKWLATGLAVLLLLGAGVVGVLMRPGSGYRALSALQRESEKKRIFASLDQLDKARDAGDVGPEYHARERNALRDSLALLLRDDKAADVVRASPQKERSVASTESEARRQLALGVGATLLFAAVFPFVGLFFVGALRNAVGAAAAVSGEERQRLRLLAAAAAAACFLWVGGVVGGAVWLAFELM